MVTARESLLALAFDDVDAMENGATILRGSSKTNFKEFDRWDLHDLVINNGGDGRPQLQRELTEIVAGCEGDPLVLLQQAASDIQSSTLHGEYRFPLNTFARDRRELHLNQDVADAHLHSGASIPGHLLLSGLVATTQLSPPRSTVDPSKPAPPMRFHSAGGVEWELFPLLCAIRWALRLLHCVNRLSAFPQSAELSDRTDASELLSLVQGQAYWRELRALATDRDWRSSHFEDKSRWQPLLAEEASIESYGFNDSFWKFASNASFMKEDWARVLVWGLVRAICAVMGLINARKGEGLARFARRFNAMRVARETGLSEVRKLEASYALEATFRSDQVVGAEFRVTARGRDRRDFKRRILNHLNDHYRAFVEFVGDRELALSMPIGFQRIGSEADGGWRAHQELDHAFMGLRAICDLRQQNYSEARMGGFEEVVCDAITAIDVAGDEAWSASWPYCAVAELLRRDGLDLSFLIHAGESFSHELNGVRKVGELFLAARPPDRIGHALALSTDVAKKVCDMGQAPAMRVGDALSDLAWAHGVVRPDRLEIERAMTEVCEASDLAVSDPEVWVEAYKHLFDVDRLDSIGLIRVENPIRDSSPTPRHVFVDQVERGSEVQRAVAAYAYGSLDGQEGWDIGAPLPPCVGKLVVELGDRLAKAGRVWVKEQIAEHGTVIESCPSSNVRLAGLSGVDSHPVWEWAEWQDPNRGEMAIAVGSDDPAIFGTTIVDEFNRLSDCGPDEVVAQLAETSVRVCSGGRRWGKDDFNHVVETLRKSRDRWNAD